MASWWSTRVLFSGKTLWAMVARAARASRFSGRSDVTFRHGGSVFGGIVFGGAAVVFVGLASLMCARSAAALPEKVIIEGGFGRDVEKKSSPFGAATVQLQEGEDYTDEERAELDNLVQTVHRFDEEAQAFRALTHQIIEEKYKSRRQGLFDSYESKIVALEAEQRQRRLDAIARFEAFLARYPSDSRYTPDAMFRLSELYFERSYDIYFQQQQRYDRSVAAWDPESGAPEPVEPSFHYEPTIAMMQQLITDFPDYRLLDGAYYLLGYCLGEQGEEERAVEVYEELVARRPDSRFGAEVWTRIGEYYFNTNELDRALFAYSKVLGHVESPFYDKALYKLAWTHYRLADPERAPQEYQLAVDSFIDLLDFNEKTKAEGHERGVDLRQEAVQYVAICFAEEQWGGIDRATNFFAAGPKRPYEREVLRALGDVFFDQTRFGEAVRILSLVQQRWPHDPEAPETQQKIITALERDRNFSEAAQARELLTASYSEGTAWYEKNAGNPKAIRTANDLTEKSLYSAALFHHRQAQIHKEAQKIDLAKESYGKAAEAYGAYLRRFPHTKQLYELTYYYAECLYYSLQFDRAAEAYARVRDANAAGKFAEEAAFSVVLSFENAIKVAEVKGELEPLVVRKSTDREPGSTPHPQGIPSLRLRLIEASDRYAQEASTREKVPKVLYKAAEIYYALDHFEEARQRFQAILASFPEHEVAEFASNLIIESYLIEQNFTAVAAFSGRMLKRPEVQAHQEFANTLTKFKTGAMFKLGDELVAKKEFEKAAKMYLELIDENPNTQFADSALNNAAVAYEEVKRFDSASKLYERLVRDYPDSPLADTALFRVGVNAERFFDFDKAIEAYLALIKKYPKSERRADAIYNGALALENTQDYETSAGEYLRYCKLFAERDDAPQVCFRAGAVYEKMGDDKRAVETFRNFIRKYQKKGDKHRDRIVEAHLRIAKASEKLGDSRDAQKYFQATVKLAGTDDAKSAPYAAEAEFNLVERAFAAFKKIAIDGNTKQQKRALTEKANVLKDVQESYQRVLRFKQIDWTLAALFRIGQLYQDFADKLINAPCPQDVRRAAKRMGATADEVCSEYRILLEERAASIEDKAVQAFETTVQKAREFQMVNKWTKQTLVALNRLRRSLWPLQKDAKFFLDTMAPGPAPVVDLKGVALKLGVPSGANVVAQQGGASESPAQNVDATQGDGSGAEVPDSEDGKAKPTTPAKPSPTPAGS